MFPILWPKNNALLLPSHFTIVHFSFFYILFFSHVLHYILPYFFSHYILCLFFHSFISLISLFLCDLSFLISHIPFLAPSPSLIPHFLILHHSPLMISPIFYCGISQVQALSVIFHLCFFLTSLLLTLEVAPSFKYKTRQGYVQGKPVSLCSDTQEYHP